MNRFSPYCPLCEKHDDVRIVYVQEGKHKIVKLHCARCNHTFDIEEGFPVLTASSLYVITPNSLSPSGSSIFYSSEEVT